MLIGWLGRRVEEGRVEWWRRKRGGWIGELELER